MSLRRWRRLAVRTSRRPTTCATWRARRRRCTTDILPGGLWSGGEWAPLMSASDLAKVLEMAGIYYSRGSPSAPWWLPSARTRTSCSSASAALPASREAGRPRAGLVRQRLARLPAAGQGLVRARTAPPLGAAGERVLSSFWIAELTRARLRIAQRVPSTDGPRPGLPREHA